MSWLPSQVAPTTLSQDSQTGTDDESASLSSEAGVATDNNQSELNAERALHAKCGMFGFGLTKLAS